MEPTVVKISAERGPRPAPETADTASELGAECKISSHVLLEAVDREYAGLPVLHQDLFDAAQPVVFSALGVLGRWRDHHSMNLVSRLLNVPEEDVQAAAVKALGALGDPGSLRVLSEMLKVVKSERVRGALLEALATLAPQNPSVLSLLRDTAFSRLASVPSRSLAARLLTGLEGAAAAERLLDAGEAPIIDAVYGAASESGGASAVVLRHGASRFLSLSKENRKLLVALAGSTSAAGAGGLLLDGLADPDPEVRRATYKSLGTNPSLVNREPGILFALSEAVDPVPNLEEEALSAIERLETGLRGTRLQDASFGQRIHARIEDLFKSLCARDRQIVSESHELGWLMSRSREYLEYYADEEFRQALISSLKGGSYYTANKLLSMLKATAVKVEVRHFDGYKALANLIQNPKRHGMALVVRELAIAKLGKREVLNRLIRSLRLSRLASALPDAAAVYLRIYTWAKEARIYRLAEAALQALISVDRVRAAEVCEECLAPPVFSKVCVITALRLLKHLDWQRMEASVQRLLAGTDDAIIHLNLLDALANLKQRLGGDMVRDVVKLLVRGSDQEVANRAAVVLGSLEDTDILAHITADFEQAEPWRQDLVLAVIERQIAEARVGNREGLSEFLYKELRSDSGRVQARAAVILWKLDDEYALNVLQDFFGARDLEQQADIVRQLQGTVNVRLLPVLQPLLRREHASLQEALRTTLCSAVGEDVRAGILAAVLSLRGAAAGTEEAADEGQPQVSIDFEREKKAFRFEREHVQELAILFTDIQGYSKKAQALSSLQLASLIQEYEGILLPTFAMHRGELIKKMGDGHLFVFQNALDATLAAIRVQKALKRFNSYREEALRVVIRIGVHWGKVVSRDGDVLGNNVNIASRLESSAQGGSILVSDAVHQLLQGQVHAREIGLIEVKNITEPIKVYEPYEIVVDLPPELDPLKRIDSAKRTGVASPSADGSHASRQELTLDRTTVAYLGDTFTTLARMCQEAERGKIPVEAIRRELSARWQRLHRVLSGRRPA